MNKLASTKTGVSAVMDVVNVYDIQPSQDGLEFASPGDFSKWQIDGIKMPQRLRSFLDDLRVLRRIPISYLVPDSALLPPESIRFFHVNQTWIDRVVDGVFSNTNVGTVDFHYSLTTLQLVRKVVDPAPGGMTGILIRSELVRRWPRMIADAYSNAAAGIDDPPTINRLRGEAISRDIYIALFAGQPKRIHIREPFEGVRFGVETNDAGDYVVDKRDKFGQVQNAEVLVPWRNQARRTINVLGLQGGLDPEMQNPRGVGLSLEQRPFVQVFLDSVPESRGSVAPPPNLQVPLRNGKLFTLKFAQQALFTLDL
jgi:hypothetical protein